jgi:predicted dienelactone hydrolase
VFRFLMAALLAAAPIAARASEAPSPCDARWSDPSRGGRIVPVRIRMPAGAGRAPVILFSHGLGGSLDAGTDWVQAWASSGFITVNIQHEGSDTAVWKGKARPMRGLRNAMSAEQLAARAEDVHFVINTIARGGREGACDLGRADIDRLGMSGHSFGAQTTLAVSGARYAGGQPLLDRRVKASIAFSPQPAAGEDDRTAFGAISIPFFTVTGTKDALVWLNGVTAQDRLRPYQAMPPDRKYLLVMEGANHAMLGGQNLRPGGITPPPGMEAAVIEATTLFWRATLMGDRTAAGRLDAFGSHLPAGDSFSEK